jgi:hypothetical protein
MSLMKPLAIRLGGQTTPAKSLVMPHYPNTRRSGFNPTSTLSKTGNVGLKPDLQNREVRA